MSDCLRGASGSKQASTSLPEVFTVLQARERDGEVAEHGEVRPEVPGPEAAGGQPRAEGAEVEVGVRGGARVAGVERFRQADEVDGEGCQLDEALPRRLSVPRLSSPAAPGTLGKSAHRHAIAAVPAQALRQESAHQRRLVRPVRQKQREDPRCKTHSRAKSTSRKSSPPWTARRNPINRPRRQHPTPSRTAARGDVRDGADGAADQVHRPAAVDVGQRDYQQGPIPANTMYMAREEKAWTTEMSKAAAMVRKAGLETAAVMGPREASQEIWSTTASLRAGDQF